jgi:molecular chaperone GrpE
VVASRWYATEPEAGKDDAAAETKDAKGEGETADPLKKDLEAKEKEILELKVCRHYRVRHQWQY